MGGINSGRAKQHKTTNEYLQIDAAHLRKHDLLGGSDTRTHGKLSYALRWKNRKEEISEENYSLSFLVDQYAPGATGEFTRWGAVGHVSVGYSDADNTRKPFTLPLLTTHPHYGGTRYWFLSPCCGKRVRVLYLPPTLEFPAAIPACRGCLNLHYASQQQSYIERHKTYERLLLANFGYSWAQWEYSKLKEHYQEITPQWRYVMHMSVARRNLELTEHLIQHNRVMLKTHMQTLRSLKSADDRLTYTAHLVKTYGQSYVLDLIRMTRMSEQIQKDIAGLSQEDFEQAYLKEAEADGKYPTEPTSLHALIERKKEIEDELKQLKPAA